MHWSDVRKPLVSIFIGSYIVIVAVWLMPTSPHHKLLVAPLRPLMLYTGLWQSFDVFAPNPRDVNLDLEAIVSFEDGSQTTWKYPRMEQLGIVERIFKERWRKFGHDHLNWDAESVLWPDFARYVARQTAVNGKVPGEVKLVRHWAVIPPIETGLGAPPPEHANSYQFFSYRVQPEDLR